MKTQNFDVHGVYSLTDCACIEIHIKEGYDSCIMWRVSIIDHPLQKWHEARIDETATGRTYFRAGNMRIYLDQVIRV